VALQLGLWERTARTEILEQLTSAPRILSADGAEFIQALLLHFREHGKKAIEKVAREQPASYLKILALLVPRQHKLEHSNSLKNWTDEEIEAGIDLVKQMLESCGERSGHRGHCGTCRITGASRA
jgi:hypothetical protein